MKTAVLYNPNAGKRISVKLVLQRLSDFFAGDELLVANPALEIPGVHITPVSILQTANSNYVSYLNNMVDALVQAGADRFVCVGGDGTATYVRTALYAAGQDLPIMGVAAGTANVGPIVSVTLDQLDGRNVQQAKEVCYDGIAVLEGNRLISLAFNDLVVGDTFLSTVDGRPCNTSVSALVKRGEIVVQSPSTDIVTDEFHVKLNGLTCRPSVREIHQIKVNLPSSTTKVPLIITVVTSLPLAAYTKFGTMFLTGWNRTGFRFNRLTSMTMRSANFPLSKEPIWSPNPMALAPSMVAIRSTFQHGNNIPFHIDHTMGLILGTDYITFSNCYNAISLDSNRTVFNDSLPHSLSCHCDHNAVVKQNVQHSLSLQVTGLLGHPLVFKKRRCLHPIFIVYTKNDKSQL